jgi:hypothetical protein
MSTSREKHYECVFKSGDVERTVHISAWDASAAESEFREALVGSGIDRQGTILIRDRKGRVHHQARYEPVAAAFLA